MRNFYLHDRTCFKKVYYISYMKEAGCIFCLSGVTREK